MRTCHKTLGYLLRKAPHPGKRILSCVAGLQRRLICFHLPTTADMRSGTERAPLTNANSAVTETAANLAPAEAGLGGAARQNLLLPIF